MKYLKILIILISIVSCNNDIIFKQKTDFNDYTWSKDKYLVYNFEIIEPGLYNLFINLRYINGFPYTNLKILCELPNKQNYKSIINVKKSNGEYYGELIGDYGDIEHLIIDNYLFEDTGRYQVKIYNTMNNDFTSYLNSIEFFVSKQTNKNPIID